MRLPQEGIDIFYIDESTDRDILVMVAVAVPFIRLVEGTYTVVWEDHLANIKNWRKKLFAEHGIPVTKEIKGSKLISGRGRYLKGKYTLTREAGFAAYQSALSGLGFLQSESIITAVGQPTSKLYDHTRLEAVLYALLQRMQRACAANNRLGLVFFDEGHSEYRKLYRKAKVYLPTGSDRGNWGNGKATQNIPLENFTKDGNTKDSQHCWFTQLADLVSYAALVMIRSEFNLVPQWQKELNTGNLYRTIPVAALNTHASRRDPLGIVRVGL